jgi:hypothetical protein
MINKVIIGVIASLATAAIISAFGTEKRVTILEQKELALRDMIESEFKATKNDLKFILCKMGEGSACAKLQNSLIINE